MLRTTICHVIKVRSLPVFKSIPGLAQGHYGKLSVAGNTILKCDVYIPMVKSIFDTFRYRARHIDCWYYDPFCHLRQVSWHHLRHHVILHQTLPCYHQSCSSPPTQSTISIYLHPRAITIHPIRLFNIYIRTLLEYGNAATCVANPSRFVQWERLQMPVITKTLDLPNTLDHDILRWHILTNRQYTTDCCT